MVDLFTVFNFFFVIDKSTDTAYFVLIFYKMLKISMCCHLFSLHILEFLSRMLETKKNRLLAVKSDQIFIFYNQYLSEFYAHSCYQQVCSSCYDKQQSQQPETNSTISKSTTEIGDNSNSETIFFNMPYINPLLKDKRK